MHEELKELVKYFPNSSGVYLMKDRKGTILYVGKAIHLKKRVSSYFSHLRDAKVRVLLKNTNNIEHISTKNEYEALLLENNLIKQWQPRYNINLKDGKSYPVIRITADQFPRVFRTRRIIQDGSEYYGPYPSVRTLDTYLEIIEKLFPLRKCKGKLKKREHPCLYYHIHRCAAPCAGLITREAYLENVSHIRKLLSGKSSDLVHTLKAKMQEAVTELQFEKAAEYRDAIQAVSAVGKEQQVVDFNPETRDYIAVAERDALSTFVVFQMRSGKLMSRDLFMGENSADFREAISQFVLQYYSGKDQLPNRLYLPDGADVELIGKYFEHEKGVKIRVLVPQRGKHASILRMALENGLVNLDQRSRVLKNEEGLHELQQVLGLNRSPRRIEGFDISQLSGQHPVASMVSFFDGVPDKKNYRYFHIKSLDGGIDDFKAMREVVARRYTRVVNEGLEKPDLILVDGGKGQVNAARSVLTALDLEAIPVAGLAKREEEIFVPDIGKPYRLPETSEALRVLQKVRDESHRFATSFNKRLRQKDVRLSTLEEIPGIGETRSKALIMKFGSLEGIRDAKAVDVAKVARMSVTQAEQVIDHARVTIGDS